MIAFACSHCGMKLKVRREFGGRHSKCPSCKQPLVVPLPSLTVSASPPQEIGAESSLAKAGIDGGVTLDQQETHAPGTAIGKRPIGAVLAARGKSRDRYVIEGEIARGGMGAVLRAVDCDIRREVAVKYLLDQADPRKRARFVEEAQINGQLEHPNIVPVYDLGIDGQKRPFIMMKMVKGRSLKDVLDQLRANRGQAEKEYSLGRLLNILVNVCHALAYAHARGVVHRDLKPANIMLGDFGEVYVMDWGLAKVLNQPTFETTDGAPMAPVIGSTQFSAKVVTNRELEADLTQEGSVLGTPAYMPPEQAAGRLQAIDQRSDVYSLGAILYEMLTLQLPVDKEGGHLAILMRVVQGEIIPPEQRAAARQGKVPRELSAIACKALAREPGDRYPNVEGLRHDIERFQEGRSVSAKEDTKREMLWKFVKRNKGLSAGVTVALVVLLCSTIFLFKAWWETSQATAASELARQEKEKRTQQAVPALMVAAREIANHGDFESALEQAAVVLDYDPSNADVYLLRGQISIAVKQPSAARAQLKEYLRRKPGDADARKLMQLCNGDRFEDPVTLLAIAELLQRQRAFGPAAPLLADVDRAVKERKPMLPLYQKQVDAAWPGLGSKLSLDKAGQFCLNLWDCKQVTSLDRLKGLPLGRLNLNSCDIRDLTPLKGMPLTSLDIAKNEQIRDLTPLQGMPLFELDMYYCLGVSDLKALEGMPLTSLKAHRCSIQDLSPLKGMSLSYLDLSCTRVRDLAPLEGMPLTFLNVSECMIRDLTPLRGMPLNALHAEKHPQGDERPPGDEKPEGPRHQWAWERPAYARGVLEELRRRRVQEVTWESRREPVGLEKMLAGL